MLRVRLITNSLDLSEYTEHEPAALLPFLQEQFPVWPETARLYKDGVSVETDVTPASNADVAALEDADGLYYVVVYPGNPIVALIALVVVVILAAVVLYFLMPKIPKVGSDDQSSNNSLGQRVNKPRPNARIEDIFGTVRSIPTLLTVPLVTFEGEDEVEICLMSIGRGSYDIADVRDGDTPLASIQGAGAEFYGPGTRPGNGDPFFTIGTPISQGLNSVVKLNEINGQALKAPNGNAVNGEGDIRFVAPNRIERRGNAFNFDSVFSVGALLSVNQANIDGGTTSSSSMQTARFAQGGIIQFQTYNPTNDYAAGSSITISNGGYAANDDNGNPLYVDLSGNYVVASVNANSITLRTPASVNSDWNQLGNYPNNRTEYKSAKFSTSSTTDGYNLDGTYTIDEVAADHVLLASPDSVNAAWDNLVGASDYTDAILSTSAEGWVGPFTIDMPDLDQVVVNFTAPQGMYRINKKGKSRPWAVSMALEVTPIDDGGTPTGAPQVFNQTIYGDGQDKRPKGVTLYARTSTAGRCRIRARRTSNSDHDSDDTIIDEVSWRDAYGLAGVTVPDYGDVTTVFSRTYATSGATSAKERKLNCMASRRVYKRNSDNTFGPDLVASNSAADIFCHLALDPYIGGRTVAELDVAQIYGTVADVVDYFGFAEAGQFGYTFDQDGITFEEMAETVAQAVFCGAYRQGSVHRLFFEKQTPDSTLLFNHRNKLPGTESRSVRFAALNDYDGVELDYSASEDGDKLTIYIPSNRSAVKPKKLEMKGVQAKEVATLHANRAYNKIMYQHTTVEFTTLSEATQLVRSEKIDVADNTRPDTDDGSVVSVVGLTVELSQPFYPVDGANYVMFVQLPIGRVEGIPVKPGADPYHVVLTRPPSHMLALDAAAEVAYQITSDQQAGRTMSFLVASKGEYDREQMTLSLQAVNYDERYYQNDFDYKGVA